MDRRSFLFTSAAAMQVRGANDRVNIAVIGVGGRGRSHVNEYCKLQDARVAAVCDIDQAQTERAVAIAEKAQGTKPKTYVDMRKLFDDKDVDAVSIATPNHWHALSTIWACQAGKDVYVEKPASYNVFEGERMVAAARRHNRVVQVGMQSRSTPHKMKAIELVRNGAIGKVYMAKGFCFKRRATIGHKPDEPVPPGVDWDLFLGPAPLRPFNQNRFRYNWHWFWDTGNGDIGNQGIHEMDIARWGLNRELPTSVVSTGGKFVYDDDQETPNTQIATFDYGDATLVFEVRGLPTGGEMGLRSDGTNVVGNIFYGSDGFLAVDDSGFQIFLGERRQPGEAMKADRGAGSTTAMHMKNFIDAIRSRKYPDLTGEVAIGSTSAELVHIANVSYRLKRRLTFDPKTHKFPGDSEATAMLTRPKYRAPYVVT